MANLTITVPDDVLKRARVRAAEQDTSVNAVLREELARFAGRADAASVAEEILALAARASGSSGPEGHNWSRDDLYAERMDRVRAGDRPA